jgi:hypothetical protein
VLPAGLMAAVRRAHGSGTWREPAERFCGPVMDMRLGRLGCSKLGRADGRCKSSFQQSYGLFRCWGFVVYFRRRLVLFLVSVPSSCCSSSSSVSPLTRRDLSPDRPHP